MIPALHNHEQRRAILLRNQMREQRNARLAREPFEHPLHRELNAIIFRARPSNCGREGVADYYRPLLQRDIRRPRH